MIVVVLAVIIGDCLGFSLYTTRGLWATKTPGSDCPGVRVDRRSDCRPVMPRVGLIYGTPMAAARTVPGRSTAGCGAGCACSTAR